MNYLSRITTIMGLVALLYVAVYVKTGLSTDPSDDFGHMSAQAAAVSQDLWMPEHRVARVLNDRLDLFPKSMTQRLAHHLVSLCEKYRFDPALILSMIAVESNFRVKVESNMGAIGLMQIQPETAEFVAKRTGIKFSGPRSLEDPFTNLSLGVAYLSYLREKYRGRSEFYHFAAYNLGPGKTDKLIRQPKRMRPGGTQKYFKDIKQGVPSIRMYPQGKPKGRRVHV